MSLLAPCSRDLVSILFVFYFETKGTVLQFFYLNSFNHNIVAYQSLEKVGVCREVYFLVFII